MVVRSDDSGPEPEVIGFDQTGGTVAGLDRWVDLARRTLVGEGVQRGRLDLIFVDAEEMADLNQAHMGHDGPTDVLSFPLDADHGAEADDGTPVHLGDIVICPAVAERQAPSHCGTVDAELSLLTIHGVLHILGHDHGDQAETEAMQARERHHLAGCGFAHPVPA